MVNELFISSRISVRFGSAHAHINMALPYKIVILKIYHIMEKIKENVQIKNERSKIHIFHEVQNAISFP